MSDEGELMEMMLERLKLLEEINLNTFQSDRPINYGPVQRWIEDMRRRIDLFKTVADEW